MLGGVFRGFLIKSSPTFSTVNKALLKAAAYCSATDCSVFGWVYVGVNLDSRELLAIKQVHFYVCLFFFFFLYIVKFGVSFFNCFGIDFYVYLRKFQLQKEYFKRKNHIQFNCFIYSYVVDSYNLYMKHCGRLILFVK